MNSRLKKLAAVSPLKIAVFVIFVALIAFFADTPFLRFMELKMLDLRMVSRGQMATGGEIVIATIDEKSLSELGRWPWPRTTVARLVDALKKCGAKTVAFDIVFSEPDENSSLKTIAELSREMKTKGLEDARLTQLLKGKERAADTDAILARAVEKAQNVTLGYFFHMSGKETAHLTAAEIAEGEKLISNSRYPLVQSRTKTDESNLIRAYAAQANLKALSRGAANSGYFNAFPDPDGVIRWSPLVIKLGENYYYSLAMAALLQYLDQPMVKLTLSDYGVEALQIDDVPIPVDESGRLLINYLGPAKTFPHYSVTDILHGRLSQDLFKDRIVIVGLSVPRVRAVYGVFLSLGLMTAFVVANALIFIHYRIWMNMIYPLLTMATIYLMITVYHYIKEEREKKKIRGAFQYYLTASVVNEILKDPSKLKLGGDKKDLTVMFSDIRGFTSISEKLTPEELVRLLNEYLTAMTDIVFKYDGLLDKYIGDAIMAVFGAPIDQPDHPQRACRVALEMMATLKQLQAKWEQEGRPYVDIGIGINSGAMVVGNMGSDMRFDYTVMGDNVNLSSRLEGINKEYGTNIILSEYTYERIKNDMYCREVDSVRVKGKKLPVKIYELICLTGDAAVHEPYVRPFEEGLSKYKEGRWDDAIALFRKVLEIRPNDPPSLLYIDRCEELRTHPPEGTWDGVFTMTRK